MKNEIDQFTLDSFEHEPKSSIRKARAFIKLLIFLYNEKTIIISSISMALLTGFSLYLMHGNIWIVPISLGINFLLVKFWLMKYHFNNLENEQAEFHAQLNALNQLLNKTNESSK